MPPPREPMPAAAAECDTGRMSDRPTLLDLDQFASLSDAVESLSPGQRYEDIAVKVVEAADGVLTTLLLFFMSAVTRARCLQEGVALTVKASNPHAAFPLIRQFAETVAVVFYVADHPDYVAALMEEPRHLPKNVKRKGIQALIAHMDKRYSNQFKTVYADLCEITHYGSFAWATPFRLASETDESVSGRFTWASGPRWRDERQGLIACAQTLELAAAMSAGLTRLGRVCAARSPDRGLEKPPP